MLLNRSALPRPLARAVLMYLFAAPSSLSARVMGVSAMYTQPSAIGAVSVFSSARPEALCMSEVYPCTGAIRAEAHSNASIYPTTTRHEKPTDRDAITARSIQVPASIRQHADLQPSTTIDIAVDHHQRSVGSMPMRDHVG